ncbi:MAG TPA: histidine kinase dimerization/phosphoacceptor domain -containing protein [Xanthobacteraceae bacterium]|nr:histidine kinase dimerization/phosphoacceptor domain -containing protein [Xanthobacteraceae bacterium]
MSLRSRLAVVVTMAMVPPLAITAYNTYAWREFLERRANQEALDSARLVSAELSQLVEGSRRLMITLVKHPAVPGREEECAAYFKAVISDLPIYREAALIDRDGKFHCSTIPIPPALDVRDRLYFSEPLRTGKLTIGTLTTGRVTGERSIHISIPYKSPDGRFDGIIALVLNPDRIGQEFAERRFQIYHRIMVVDREGSLVFTIPNENEAGAQAMIKQVFASAHTGGDHVFVVKNDQGDDQILGVVPLEESPEGMFVAVAIDRDLALAEFNIVARRSVVFGALALLFALAGILAASDALIRRPVLGMVRVARRREGGDLSAQFPRLRSSTELGELSGALRAMSVRIDELLAQKEFLLRELQHRVMNSLQILSSLLGMQGREAVDPAARIELARARERVMGMSAIYKYLYGAEVSEKVDFGELLRAICAESEKSYSGESRTITCESIPLIVSGGQAASLAVLVNELITNALKHAYPEGEPGPILVRLLRNEEGMVELRVADRGGGFTGEVDLSRPASLGLKVIVSTARQFGGTVSFIRLDPGTEFVVRFPPEFGSSPESAAA